MTTDLSSREIRVINKDGTECARGGTEKGKCGALNWKMESQEEEVYLI